VYAVERDPGQLALLRENRSRHLATNLEVVAGEAPAALRRLPDPDTVFVGGSGGKLAGILRVALARLRPGGRLVLNAVLLETLAEAERRCHRAGWATEVCQVTVARGERTATGLRLAASNPVFVLTARRPEGE
jgi:precorrin-6Y C5,15-methyltransferase (decarboxylating)